MHAKYLILHRGGRAVPVVWPADAGITHAEMSTHAPRLPGHPVRFDVLGAGFTYPEHNWACGGESLSLDVKSRGETDAAILRDAFGFARPEPVEVVTHHSSLVTGSPP